MVFGDWQPVLIAQSALLNGNPEQATSVLDKMPSNITPAQRVIALYYRGLAIRDLEKNDPVHSTEQWKLTLLQIPAQYQDLFPELAAAAVYQVWQGSQDAATEYASLTTELTGRFSQTWHGRHYQSSGN